MFSSRKYQLNRYHSQGDPRRLALSLADSLQEVMTISAHSTFLAIPAANQKSFPQHFTSSHTSLKVCFLIFKMKPKGFSSGQCSEDAVGAHWMHGPGNSMFSPRISVSLGPQSRWAWYWALHKHGRSGLRLPKLVEFSPIPHLHNQGAWILRRKVVRTSPDPKTGHCWLKGRLCLSVQQRKASGVRPHSYL